MVVLLLAADFSLVLIVVLPPSAVSTCVVHVNNKLFIFFLHLGHIVYSSVFHTSAKTWVLGLYVVTCYCDSAIVWNWDEVNSFQKLNYSKLIFFCHVVEHQPRKGFRTEFKRINFSSSKQSDTVVSRSKELFCLLIWGHLFIAQSQWKTWIP